MEVKKILTYSSFVILLLIALISVIFIGYIKKSTRAEMSNDTISIVLESEKNGIPFLKECVRLKDSYKLFSDNGLNDDISEWIPEPLIPGKGKFTKKTGWQITQDSVFMRAESARNLKDGLRMVWVVELAKEGSLFRFHIRMENTSDKPAAVPWFPVWNGSWKEFGEVERMRWWQSLLFTASEKAVPPGQEIILSSWLHSSDEYYNGVNPYWMVSSTKNHLYFGLEWCGGWKAKVKGMDDGFSFAIWLPPEETQLTLNPGESMDGPIASVYVTTNNDDMAARKEWLDTRMDYSKKLYNPPETIVPLLYNHWYDAEFSINADYFKRQVKKIPTYGFDIFTVDAGWYEKVGSWVTDSNKFKPGELRTIFDDVKKMGVKPGIWTCPQYLSDPDDPRVDKPGYNERFIKGYLIDYADNKFPEFLTGHVKQLIDNYGIEYWKYDQKVFADKTRAGMMKNVTAFQNGLKDVRKMNPGLMIECCDGGGRIINELTMNSSDVVWLRDGGWNGMEHTLTNISEVLYALEFVFPCKGYRFTNRIYEMNADNPELIKMYCRSAMPGVWGMSDDLTKINQKQHDIIVKEIKNYRRLNELKKDNYYEIFLPLKRTYVEPKDNAGIVFYDIKNNKAGILLYRWGYERYLMDANFRDPIEKTIDLKNIDTGKNYRIEDADTGKVTIINGSELKEKGLKILMDSGQLSAIVFVEPEKN